MLYAVYKNINLFFLTANKVSVDIKQHVYFPTACP